MRAHSRGEGRGIPVCFRPSALARSASTTSDRTRACWLTKHQMRGSVFWISGPWRGRLAIVLRPRGGDWLDGETRVWRHAGVDVVVSLLEPSEETELDL